MSYIPSLTFETQPITSVVNGVPPTPPIVPVRTAFFQGQPFTPLTSVWDAFFRAVVLALGQTNVGGEIFWRVLLLNNLTAGNNIAPALSAQAPGTAIQVTAVLRKSITAALQVRINQNGNPLIVCSLNPAASVLTPYTWTSFATNGVIAAGDVFTFDVLASDGSSDPNGVAAFTLQWQ